MDFAIFPPLAIILYLAAVAISFALRDIEIIYGWKRFIFVAVYSIVSFGATAASMVAALSLKIMTPEWAEILITLLGAAVVISLISIWIYIIDTYGFMARARKKMAQETGKNI